MKKLDKQTREFIERKEKAVVKDFTYPKLNEYVPKNLELVTICEAEKETSGFLSEESNTVVLNSESARLHSDGDIYSFLDQSSARIENEVEFTEVSSSAGDLQARLR